jgi:hypothetical protein
MRKPSTWIFPVAGSSCHTGNPMVVAVEITHIETSLEHAPGTCVPTSHHIYVDSIDRHTANEFHNRRCRVRMPSSTTAAQLP